MKFCHANATMMVYLDGDGPPTPMCQRHGAMYVDDADYKWSQMSDLDAGSRCQYVLSMEDQDSWPSG